jgi:hypothetical protein
MGEKDVALLIAAGRGAADLSGPKHVSQGHLKGHLGSLPQNLRNASFLIQGMRYIY